MFTNSTEVSVPDVMFASGLSSGFHFLYNPETAVMYYLSEGNYQYHMVICFEGPEIGFELAEWIEDEEFKNMLAQFGDYFARTPERGTLEQITIAGEGIINAYGAALFKGEMAVGVSHVQVMD